METINPERINVIIYRLGLFWLTILYCILATLIILGINKGKDKLNPIVYELYFNHNDSTNLTMD